MKKDLYVIRKYVFANSIEEALQKEKQCKANDCWLDDHWRSERLNKKIDDLESDKIIKNIGFRK